MDERFTVRNQNTVEWGRVGSGGWNSGKSRTDTRPSCRMQSGRLGAEEFPGA